MMSGRDLFGGNARVKCVCLPCIWFIPISERRNGGVLLVGRRKSSREQLLLCWGWNGRCLLSFLDDLVMGSGVQEWLRDVWCVCVRLWDLDRGAVDRCNVFRGQANFLPQRSDLCL